MNKRAGSLTAAFLLAELAAHAALAASPTTWNLELTSGKSARSTVTVSNRCHGPHSFEVTKSAELTWLSFPSGTKAQPPPGGSVVVDVGVDAGGLEPGEYEGQLSVRCLDCSKEPLCTQDVDLFRPRLKVLWSAEGLKNLEQEEFLPQQVLMLLEASEAGAISKVTQQLEKRYPIRREKTFELPSISRTLVLFRILARDLPVQSAVGRIQAEESSRLVQPNFLYRLAQASPRYNDPYADLQYAPRQMRADQAQRLTTGRNVKVAVLDSGVDSKHADLSGAVAESFDLTGEGRTVPGEVHGTAMAGVIGARANNGIGIYGVAPDITILAARVCAPRSPDAAAAQCSSEAIARGLDLAILREARVVNLSLGGPRDPLLRKLVSAAVNRGIVVVAAAGNEGPKGRPNYPAALENVIAVSAIDNKGNLYESANRGSYVDLVAPGVDVLSTAPGGLFRPYTGTSVAAAQVTGVVALLLQAKPEMTPAEVQSLLESTARDLGAPGKDELYGSGAIDACNALAKLTGDEKLCH